jgi:hypothetical protein
VAGFQCCGRKYFLCFLCRKMDTNKHFSSEAKNMGYQHVAGTVLRNASGEGHSVAPTLRWQTTEKNRNINLDDWLTVHRSITLVDLQLDAHNYYLFTYNTFVKILYMFRALPCLSSGGLRRNCIQSVLGGMWNTSGECSLC